MSYTVLARKWRPQKFEDVVGQAHVTRSLVNALGKGRIAHAYLFSGTRGVGKTTTARILAKALNCEAGDVTEPCGSCSSCNEITQGHSVDVIEIDAASNTGVDNIRELNDNVRYAPAKSKYKVYVIDEVHMLSTSAFNALLKTLEEPPPHVVFIFATTDPHKLPATILSRCQHYDFRRVSKAMIAEHLAMLCAREGITAEPKAIARLASLAEGSVRDALSLLDQVISYCGDEGIREEDIELSLGLVGREAVRGAAAAVLTHDPAEAIESVASLVDKGHDLRRFSAELLGFFRDIMVARVSRTPERTLELTTQEISALKEMASAVNSEEVIRVMNVLMRLADEMKYSAMPRTTLELALVKAASRPVHNVDEILKGIRAGGGLSAPPARAGSVPGGFPAAEQRASTPAGRTAAPKTARAGVPHDAADAWETIRNEIKRLGKAPLAGKMMGASPNAIEDGALMISEGPLPFKPEELALIAGTAKSTTGLEVKVGKGGVKGRSLADARKEKEDSRRDTIKAEALKDPLVKSAIDLFGGEIVDIEDEKVNGGEGQEVQG